MPKNAKNSVYKQKEFDLYVLWKFLPAHFKGLKKDQLVSIGFTDPLILKIIKIKNQTDFAHYFNIKDLGTLTDWNNKIKKENITSPFTLTEFQKQYSRINQEIVPLTITELKEQLAQQQKIILGLKKENESLKNQLQHITLETNSAHPTTSSVPQKESNPLLIPDNHSVNKKNITIFQKIKKLFLNS